MAFYSSGERRFKRIAVSGGAALDICPAESVYDVSWDSADEIVIGQGQAGILRCSVRGSKPETIVRMNPGQWAHGPQVLPGGDLLFTVSTSSSSLGWDRARIRTELLRSGDQNLVLEGGSDARYIPTGHLVSPLARRWSSFRSNLATRVLGEPVPIVDDVRRSSSGTSATAQFAISGNGTLVYVPGENSLSRRVFALVDRAGNRKPLSIPAGQHEHPRFSPDGRQLAFHTIDASGDDFVSIYDLRGNAPPRRLTFGGRNRKPVWTIDGLRVVFDSLRPDGNGLFWQAVDGGPAERLTSSSFQPEAWMPDGKTLVVAESRAGDWRLLTLPPGADQPRALLEGYAANSSVSHDGRWIAYNSNETGRPEVFVQPLPPTGEKHKVTTNGGRNPLWSPDSTQLYYLQFDDGGTMQLVSVEVQTQPGFRIKQTMPLPIKGLTGLTGTRYYDTRDGRNFVIVVPRSEADPGQVRTDQINVTLRWFEELKQRAPAGQD